eukprot:168660-Hanusia_phi.AAC.1
MTSLFPDFSVNFGEGLRIVEGEEMLLEFALRANFTSTIDLVFSPSSVSSYAFELPLNIKVSKFLQGSPST